MSDETLTVAELLDRVRSTVAAAVPGPVWVRGEVTGFKRTTGGAAYFRLADAEIDDHAIEVAARGRVMIDVDRDLSQAGVGTLRSGVEVRLRGTIGLDPRRSAVRISLLEVDPSFTAGRLAVDRAEVLRRMAADGSLVLNRRLAMPLVPLRVGLVTSRGSAAHADFLAQLRSSGYRFAVRTAQAAMQGETAPDLIGRGLRRVCAEAIDVAVLIRGGGSQLDLAVFDSEEVGRSVAAMPVPVLTGIGHEVDRSVADEAAAVAVKTPSAAGEWLVARVGDYAGRIETARRSIRDEAASARSRATAGLDRRAALLAGARSTLGRRRDRLDHIASGIADGSRAGLDHHRSRLDAVGQILSTIGIEPTLKRGFAVVTDATGTVIRSAASLAAGDRLTMRLADGTVPVVVDGTA